MKQTVTKTAKKTGSSWSDVVLQHTAVRPIFEHELPRSPEKSTLSHGRDFSQMPLNVMDVTGQKTNLTQACQFTPQLYPFSEVCHSCPPRLQAKLKIGRSEDKYENEANRVIRLQEMISRSIHKISGTLVQTGESKTGIAEPQKEMIENRGNYKSEIENQTNFSDDTFKGKDKSYVSNLGSTNPIIERVDVITQNNGAFSGFPKLKHIDLNKPGTINDTEQLGSVHNVFQICFRLKKGNSKEVKLLRRMQRTYRAGNKPPMHTIGPDGPSSPTVIFPNNSTIVVADSPGYRGPKFQTSSVTEREKITHGAFPIKYDGHFTLNAIDSIQPAIIAQVQYRVLIEKQSLDQSMPLNKLFINHISLKKS